MIQRTGTFVLPAQLPLSEGGLLVDAKVAFEAIGPPLSEESVVLIHDIDRSHQGLLLPAHGASWSPHGWARAFIDAEVVAGRPVLFANLLGSPFGSTSAAQRGREDLPVLSIEDMARALAALLRGLGLRRVRAVMGTGLGGFVALQFAALFPDAVRGVVALGAGRHLAESLREKLAMTPQLVESDPSGGARAARKAFIEYLRRSHGRDYLAHAFEDPFAAERELQAQGLAFSEAFPPRAWASLAQAYGTARLEDVLPLVRADCLFIASSSDEVAPPARVRDAYHSASAAGARAHYYEVQSDLGHARILDEALRLRGAIRQFLEGSG